MLDERPYGQMVQEYYVQRVRRLMQQRAEARAKVRTPRQLARLQDQIRRKLRSCFGRLPRRTPLNARVAGTVQRKHYVIEKLIYHSRPGFPVTANLYLPKRGRKPRPAVLGVCGHSNDGKAYELYQAFSRNLARQGYVVLIYDPISQGERVQYTRRDGADYPRGCCAEHTMAGNQMQLVGDFLGTWRVWDGVRGLDYLLSRPEVDPARVGVTGNSGGGTLTSYLTALDRRFAFAAPGCYVTRQLHNLENENAQDSEQCPPGLLAAGLDVADYFVASIPRPTLLLGQRNDFFDTRGLEAIYQELRRLYGIVGKERHVELFIGPREHGYHVENREAMYRFFNKHAGVRADAREPKRRRAEATRTLSAAPQGQVRLGGARRVFDFTRQAAAELAERRGPLRGKVLAAAIARRLALPERAAPPHYRALRLARQVGKALQAHPAFAAETERGIQALVHLFPREGHLFHLPPGEKAVVYVPHLSAEAEVAQDKAPKVPLLFAVEPRGVGRLAAAKGHGEDIFTTHGGEYFYGACASMLAEPYCGRRVHDLLSVLDLLESKGYRCVHLVGRGLGAITATFAACLHPIVRRVTLHNALLSYHELTQAPLQRWPLSVLVGGILKHFDLPDCLRELAARKELTVVAPWNARMRPWPRRRLRDHLKSLGLAGVKVR